jgi:3-hydroxyacyl-CoA dehydrogenase
VNVAVIGPGRIGRQIALAFAGGGCPVRLVDLKPRAAAESKAVFADARREIARDLMLMAEEDVIARDDVEATLARIADHVGLDGLRGVGFVQEALPEIVDLKRETFARLCAAVADDALMNEAVRLVEEGVATPEDVDKAFKAGMGFRYGTIGIFEFIDWGGVDILHRASGFMTAAMNDDRFRAARLVEEKIANNELGPKTGRGFFDYSGDRRDTFETEKVRALLRQLKRRAP